MQTPDAAVDGPKRGCPDSCQPVAATATFGTAHLVQRHEQLQGLHVVAPPLSRENEEKAIWCPRFARFAQWGDGPSE